MLHLMSSEEADYCSATILLLRLEMHDFNNDLMLIDSRLKEGYNPPDKSELNALHAVKRVTLKRRELNAKLIAGLREVLVNPPSLESRIIGYINRILSFRYI